MARILLFLLITSLSFCVIAHQPHIVESDATIIHNPEVSQAFYASNPGSFFIDEAQPFTLYVQILRPKIADLDKNIKATISKDDEVVAVIDGVNFDWKIFHEPFANDDYYQGPEVKMPAQGKYMINVHADGKYVLVVGEKEEWPLSEITRTIYTLPRLKTYFEKSPSLAYWNLSGAFLLGLAATSVAVIIMLRLVLKNVLRR